MFFNTDASHDDKKDRYAVNTPDLPDISEYVRSKTESIMKAKKMDSEQMDFKRSKN